MTAYAGMSKGELDREYSPSSRAPDFASILARYRTESAAAREQLVCRRDLAYGPAPAERLDYFPVPGADAPMQVYVHGGHWQESCKEDSSFAAPAFVVGAGVAFVALGYGLAPQRDLASMVASVRRGLRWLVTHAAELGCCPDLVFASGSSAGAHLVAMALATVPGTEAVPVAGACLISGVYDLEPVRLSYVNDQVL